MRRRVVQVHVGVCLQELGDLVGAMRGDVVDDAGSKPWGVADEVVEERHEVRQRRLRRRRPRRNEKGRRATRWDDPDLSMAWPSPATPTFTVSERDRHLPLLQA
jgi:hypothetical protein